MIYYLIKCICLNNCLKKNNQYRRYICICIYYKNYKSICNRIY